MAKEPLVTCRVYGQLGNQLYQLATTLSYSWDHGAVAIFPGLHNPAYRISTNKDRLFFRLNDSQPTRPFLHEFKETCWFSKERVPFREDLILDGYFQSWHHFHHHFQKIKEIFSPSAFTLEVLSSKYKYLLNRDDTVGVHVRTQAKDVHDSGVHPFLGFDYYEQAMSLFPGNATFVVCSDKTNWCKNSFKRFGKKFVFVEGNYGIEDMFLLTKMNNLIACNSSFSWWASYLNSDVDKKVIVPYYAKDPERHPNPPHEDFYLPKWIPLKSALRVPYPADMYDYDAVSQSWDR